MTRHDLSTERHCPELSMNDYRVFGDDRRENKRRANDTLTYRMEDNERLTASWKTALHRGTCYRLRDKSGTSRFRCTLRGISPGSRSRVNPGIGARRVLAWLPSVKDLIRAISRQSDSSLAHIGARAKPRKLVCGHEISAHSGQARKSASLCDWFDSTDAEIRAERDWKVWRKSR